MSAPHVSYCRLMYMCFAFISIAIGRHLFVMHCYYFLLYHFGIAFALWFRSSVIIVGAVMLARLRLLELCASKFVVSHIRLLPTVHKSSCSQFSCAHIFGICGVHLDVVCVPCSSVCVLTVHVELTSVMVLAYSCTI